MAPQQRICPCTDQMLSFMNQEIFHDSNTRLTKTLTYQFSLIESFIHPSSFNIHKPNANIQKKKTVYQKYIISISKQTSTSKKTHKPPIFPTHFFSPFIHQKTSHQSSNRIYITKPSKTHRQRGDAEMGEPSDDVRS